MTPRHARRLSGILFIAAGASFFVAALLADQVSFHGVGVALCGVGIAILVQARRNA